MSVIDRTFELEPRLEMTTGLSRARGLQASEATSEDSPSRIEFESQSFRKPRLREATTVRSLSRSIWLEVHLVFSSSVAI